MTPDAASPEQNTQPRGQFVLAHVLDRLISGRFVADRKSAISLKDAERRQVFSPLNVTRRAIRYEPLVFSTRKSLIIQAAQVLNDDIHKLLMVIGPPGRGKTAFVRGLVELLGGGKQQLLWFDVSPHTDQDEIVRFLIEYMTYVCREFGAHHQDHEALIHEDPIEALMALMAQSSDIPIVIVIDNVERLVSSRNTLRSVELRDTLNFLLGYDNVKLVLSGTKMPLSDMSANSPISYAIDLPVLEPEAAWTIIERYGHLDRGLDPTLYQHLLPLTQGEPYALYLLAQMVSAHPDSAYWLEHLSNHSSQLYKAFLDDAFSRFDPQDMALLGLMSLIRHGVTKTGLKAMASYCVPELEREFNAVFEHPHLHHLMQKVFPPQLVLDQLRNRQRDKEAMAQGREQLEPIEAFYQLWEGFTEAVCQHMPIEVRRVYHTQLQQFYMEERQKALWNRTYRARTRHLLAEAQYHANQANKLQRSGGTSNPTDSENDSEAWANDPHVIDSSHLSYVARHQPLDPLPAKVNDSFSLMEALGGSPSSIAPSSSFSSSDAMTDEEVLLIDRALRGGSSTTPALPAAAPTIVVKPTIHMTPPPTENVGIALPHPSQNLSPASAQEPLLPDQHTRELSNTAPHSEPSPSTNTSNTPPSLPQPHWLDLTLQPLEPLPSQLRSLRQHLKGLLQNELTDPTEALAPLLTLLEQINQHSTKFTLTPHQLSAIEGLYAQALNWAQDHLQAPANANSLIDIKHRLGMFYKSHFHYNQAFQWLSEAYQLTQEQSQADTEQVASLLTDLGFIHLYRHHWAQAIEVFQEALLFLSSDSQLRQETLFRLALCYDETKEPKRAVEAYHQCYKLAQAHQNWVACAAALYNLGCLYWEYGQPRKAQKVLEHCVAYDRQLDAGKDYCRTLMLLTTIYESLGDHEEALQTAQKALEVCRHSTSVQFKVDPVGRRSLLATLCLRLGLLSERLGKPKPAYRYYRQARALGRGLLPPPSLQLLAQKLQ